MKFHEISIFMQLFVYEYVALAADFGDGTCSDPTFRAKVSLSNLQLTTLTVRKTTPLQTTSSCMQLLRFETLLSHQEKRHRHATASCVYCVNYRKLLQGMGMSLSWI